MKLYALGALVCALFLHCHANPIVTITAEHQDARSIEPQVEVQKDGVKQEEAQGVFDVENAAPAQEEKTEEKPSESSQSSSLTETNDVPSESMAKSEVTAVEVKPKTKGKVKGRQSSDDDDDEDDDDDDDVLGSDDDDDDDDDDDVAADDDDDDDDGDYFGSFFDDILGGGDDDDDDDDDDDEEEEVSPPQQPAVAEAPAVQPAVDQAAIASELSASEELDAQEQAAGEVEQGALPMGQPKMPAIYISKYNRFVDTILGRINVILGKSYDPVRVKLQADETKSKNKKNTKKGKGKKKKGTRRRPQKDANEVRHKMGEMIVSRSTNQINENDPKLLESESREPAFILISKAGSNDMMKNVTVTTTELRTVPSKRRQTNKTKKNPNKIGNSTTNNHNNANKTGNKTKAGNKTKTGNKSKTGNKTKTKAKQSNRDRARATLFGLSSIKRDGDVIVNMMSDHTTVKTNFIIGPLTLRVEKEYGKGARRELKSATATTAEMYGRLNLKIMHGGAATMNSIRVLQPKQVRVDSADGHDKTREYIWQRSAHIASLVSQKLASAARSMMKRPASSVSSM